MTHKGELTHNYKFLTSTHKCIYSHLPVATLAATIQTTRSSSQNVINSTDNKLN